MHNTSLDPATMARLPAPGKVDRACPESDLLREAVTAYLEDLEDIRAAEESLREIQSGAKPLTLDELDAYLAR